MDCSQDGPYSPQWDLDCCCQCGGLASQAQSDSSSTCSSCLLQDAPDQASYRMWGIMIILLMALQ